MASDNQNTLDAEQQDATPPVPVRAPFRWAIFLPLWIVWFLAAVGGAWLMAAIYKVGLYVIVLTPGLMAYAVGFVGAGALYLGRCRQMRWIIALGLLMSLTMYFGYYYFDMVNRRPAGTWKHPEQVPAYIAQRMQKDVTVAIAPVRPGGPRPRRDVFGNWLMLSLEIVCVAGVGAVFAPLIGLSKLFQWEDRVRSKRAAKTLASPR